MTSCRMEEAAIGQENPERLDSPGGLVLMHLTKVHVSETTHQVRGYLPTFAPPIVIYQRTSVIISRKTTEREDARVLENTYHWTQG
jgi:hypothetical protein